MSKKQILFLFAAAGALHAVVIGIAVYRNSLAPSQEEVTRLLRDYCEKIASGDLSGARELMTPETREFLRDPGTRLGETIYAKFSLKNAENINAESEKIYTADAVFSTLDTLKVNAKALLLFEEKMTDDLPPEEQDRILAEIYDEILSRDDLPLIDSFCIVRLEKQDGRLLIRGDDSFRNVLEGK
ncbi:MAG: hypothetical protein IKP86_12130 [Anaerolineaceae bacterium]|nr:hypothetical protein [Anaerolineaceae bacterium]